VPRLPYVTRLYFKLPLPDVSPVKGIELTREGVVFLMFGVAV